MSKYIYFVGRPYPLAQALRIIRGMGYKAGLFLDETVDLGGLEKYDKVVKADFSSPEKLIAGIAGQNLQVDGLVCTYENYIVAKAQLAEHFGVAGPSVASAEMSTDKLLMRRAFMSADPAITPAFEPVSSEKEALEFAERFGYPLILKPANLVKSLLVLRCDNKDELLKNFAYAQERIADLYQKNHVYGRQPQLVLEECIEGKTCSVAAFVDKTGRPHFCEGITSLVNAQVLGVQDNYIYGRFLPAEFSSDLKKELFRVAGKGIKALNMSSTPAHIELIYNQRGVKLIEIGARIGGYRPRMYDISYGTDLLAQEIRLALAQLPELAGDFRAYCAVYELFPEQEGLFERIEGEPDKSRFSYYRVTAKEDRRVGPAKQGYKAAAIVIVSSSNKDEFSNLCESVDHMKVRIK